MITTENALVFIKIKSGKAFDFPGFIIKYIQASNYCLESNLITFQDKAFLHSLIFLGTFVFVIRTISFV